MSKTKDGLYRRVERLEKKFHLIRKEFEFLRKSITPAVETKPEAKEATPPAPIPRYSKAVIVFDGGMRQQEFGYGSYFIELDGVTMPIVKCEIPEANSANQAELLTLQNALMSLKRIVDPKKCKLIIIGDSKLALFCSSGKWNTRHPNILPIVQENRLLLREYQAYDALWQPRKESLRLFGH